MVLQDVVQLSSFHVSYTMPKSVTGMLSAVSSVRLSTVDAVGLQPCFYKQSVIGSDDVPGGEVGLDMELLIIELKYNISHVVALEIVRVLCFSSRTRRFLHETEHHNSRNLSRVRKGEGVLQGTLGQRVLHDLQL